MSRRPRAALAAVAVTAIFAGGCATKQDIRDLRTDLAVVHMRQDSIMRRMAEQLDSIRANARLLLRVRGELGQQLLQIEQQLIQIQELTGQSQRRLMALRQAVEQRSERLENVRMTPDTASAQRAEELYRIGVENLRSGATGTARQALGLLLRQYPEHELAPDAQFQIAETYAREGEYELALREFERVVELFPSSERAPDALYRAGVLAQDRGNISRAGEYFQRVVRGYPESEAAGAARERLDEIES